MPTRSKPSERANPLISRVSGSAIAVIVPFLELRLVSLLSGRIRPTRRPGAHYPRPRTERRQPHALDAVLPRAAERLYCQPPPSPGHLAPPWRGLGRLSDYRAACRNSTPPYP